MATYTRTDKYQGSWEGRSHSNRSAENVWQQTALDNLMDFAKDSGLGTWATSDASKASHWPSNNRSHNQRYQENVWQQSQIADLEKWAANAYGSDQGYDIAFTPHAQQNLRWQQRSHNDRLAENRWQQDAIINLQDWLEGVEGHRQPILAEEERLRKLEEQKALEESLIPQQIDVPEQPQVDLSNYISKDDLADIEQGWAGKYAEDLATAKSAWDTKFETAKGDWKTTADKEKQDLVASLSDTFADQTAQNKALYEGQISDLTSAWDITRQGFESDIGKFKDIIADQSSTIGEIQSAKDAQDSVIKGYQEKAIQDAERDRVAATYGSSGKPNNRTVKGVKTQKEINFDKPKFTSSFFGRGGSRIKNTSLNIA